MLMATTGSSVKWSPSFIVLYVDVGPQLHQLLDHLKIIINAALGGMQEIHVSLRIHVHVYRALIQWFSLEVTCTCTHNGCCGKREREREDLERVACSLKSRREMLQVGDRVMWILDHLNSQDSSIVDINHAVMAVSICNNTVHA